MNNTNIIPMPPALKPLQFYYNVLLGCDPEFFFSSKGQVIGSEKVLPQTGLKYDPVKDRGAGHDGAHTAYNKVESKIVIDGVQAELNPRPNTCRANLGNEIGACFRKLYKELQNGGKDFNVDFQPLINVTQAEMDSLSEKSKVFGCAPSTNIYKTADDAQIKVDPKKYLKRSAGGHIHLGWEADYWGGGLSTPKMRDVLTNPNVLVPILDLVVANTCVLFDRDPGNKERRVNYGRVGEFRQKDYGLEYRTLSNFWLRSYKLMSLVTGLCRLACHLVEQSTPDNDYVKALNEAVSRDDVIKAVQDNDFDLAYQNFRKIEPIVLMATVGRPNSYPICQEHIVEFHYFIKQGVDHWFKEDSFQHWVHLPEGHGHGWESFLQYTVRQEMTPPVVKKAKDVPIDLNDPKLAETTTTTIKFPKLEAYVNG